MKHSKITIGMATPACTHTRGELSQRERRDRERIGERRRKAGLGWNPNQEHLLPEWTICEGRVVPQSSQILKHALSLESHFHSSTIDPSSLLGILSAPHTERKPILRYILTYHSQNLQNSFSHDVLMVTYLLQLISDIISRCDEHKRLTERHLRKTMSMKEKNQNKIKT